MKKISFLISLLFISVINNAQITFQKTFGETLTDVYGYSPLQTTDGGYIITGSMRYFGAPPSRGCIIKTDLNGNPLWEKTFGVSGLDSNDEGYSIQQTIDGGFIIAGRTESFGAGGFDALILKTDTAGTALWSKTFGGSNDEIASSVQQTADSGYIVVGTTNSFGAGAFDIYLIKTDVNGDSLWTKTFGGFGNEESYSVRQTTDSGYIITGYCSSFGAGFKDVYLIKTDSNGNLLWSKTFGGTNNDLGYSVQQTADSGYIIVGTTYSFGSGLSDVYLIKTNANGDSLWTKTFGDSTYESGVSIQQTADGGYIIAGGTSDFFVSPGLYLVKIDVTGNIQWSKKFDGLTGGGISIQQTTDGGYIAGGTTQWFSAGAAYEVYLIKTDSLGNSGCNAGSITTVATAPATQITNPATIVTSPPTIETTAALVVYGHFFNDSTLCSNVGINKIEAGNSFLISPNPSNGKFIISFKSSIRKGNVGILNILGENIFSENVFNESKKEIILKNIFSGIYFVKVFDGEKQYIRKLIVQHD